MKKIITLFASATCFLLFLAMNVNGQFWAANGTHIYNTNAGNVGVGTNAPGYLLHVAKNATSPSIRIQNLGGAGGAAFEMIDNLSSADWKFKATTTGGFKIRDHASLLDVLTIEKNSLANALYIKQGGNVGLGVTNPLEKLHVNGAILLGNTLNSNAGTIRWDGFNFSGYNGSNWVNLDFVWNDPWILAPNIPFGNPEFCSGPQPMSLSFAFPGMPNPLARLYATDMSAGGMFPHQIAVESASLASPVIFNASQLFRMSAGMNPPFIDYSVGIYGLDGTFKVCMGAALTTTTHSDNSTAIRNTMSGIVDLPNQSRVRANVPNIDWASWQLIQPNTWTPVNYTSPLPLIPLVGGIPVWDEQAEFMVAATPNQPIVNNQPNSIFTAQTDGFYQVNARCEFEPDEYWLAGIAYPVYMRPNAYVSIAIYYDWQGAWVPYALGNNLQVTNNVLRQPPPPEFPDATQTMTNNNAPNISDVVWLQAGDRISIWVFHWAYTPMMLRVGDNVLYVSIHKVS